MRLERLVGSSWGFWAQHGDALFTHLQSLDINPMQPLALSAPKCRAATPAVPIASSIEAAAKRVKWTVPTTPFTVQQTHLFSTPSENARSSSPSLWSSMQPKSTTHAVPISPQQWQFSTPAQSHSHAHSHPPYPRSTNPFTAWMPQAESAQLMAASSSRSARPLPFCHTTQPSGLSPITGYQHTSLFSILSSDNYKPNPPIVPSMNKD